MPYRFDENTQKVVKEPPPGADLSAGGSQAGGSQRLSDEADAARQGFANAAQLKVNLPANKGKGVSVPAGSKSRTLGQVMGARQLGPAMKRGFIVISALVLLIAGLIYIVTQQSKFTQSASGGGAETVLMPRGKKAGSAAVHQALVKTAALAGDDQNFAAAARLYGHAAEEARLAGPPMAKQYIDALASQGDVYLDDLSDGAKARPCFEKVLKLQLADPSTKPARLAATYDSLAMALENMDSELYKDRIITNYQKAIGLAKSGGNPEGLARYTYNAGDFYLNQAQYDKAYGLAKESLAAYKKLHDADLNSQAFSHYLCAAALAHMPGQNHFELANKEFEAALHDFEKSEAEASTYVDCIRDAAWNKLRLGQRSEARELFEKASSASSEEDDANESKSADKYMEEALK